MKRTVLPALLIIMLIAAATGVMAACGDDGGKEATATEETLPQADVSQRESGQSAAAFSFVMGEDIYPVPDEAMPAKGASFSDMNFHTVITRVTDKAADGYEDPGISNEYAKADPENCDGTLLVLRGNSAVWYIYDARSFEMLRRLPDDVAAGAPEFEPRWDSRDPQVFYYLYGTELRSYSVESQVSSTVHDFSADVPGAQYITTGSEGDASLDRRYWAFVAKDADFNELAVIVYDREADRVVGQRDSFPDAVNFVSMDMSGRHCIVGYDSIPYEIFSPDLADSVSLPPGAAGHGDAAMLPDGREVMVYQNVATDYISMADLDTGEEIPLLHLPFDINTDLGMHISGNSTGAPGWVLVSTYGSKASAPGEQRSWMDEQLFMLELKENPRVWRLADTHAYTSLEYSAEKVYFAEAFAAVNTSGTRVYFASNWEVMTTDYTDVYVLDLPNGWQDALPR